MQHTSEQVCVFHLHHSITQRRHTSFQSYFSPEESIEDPAVLWSHPRLSKDVGRRSSQPMLPDCFTETQRQADSPSNTLPSAIVKELAAEGIALAHQKKRLAFTGTASSTFTEGTVFTTESGEQITADQITEKTVVRCPFHLDQIPSSFLAHNRNKDVYHYCSVCCVTRWAPKSIASGIPLLDDFVDTMRALSKQSNLKDFKQEQVGLEQFMDLTAESVPAVEFTESKYLPDFVIPQV